MANFIRDPNGRGKPPASAAEQWFGGGGIVMPRQTGETRSGRAGRGGEDAGSERGSTRGPTQAVTARRVLRAGCTPCHRIRIA